MNFFSEIFETDDKNINYIKIASSVLEKVKIKNKNYIFVNQKTIEMLCEKAFMKFLIFKI